MIMDVLERYIDDKNEIFQKLTAKTVVALLDRQYRWWPNRATTRHPNAGKCIQKNTSLEQNHA